MNKNRSIKSTVNVIILSVCFLILCIYLLNPVFKQKKINLASSTLINSTEPLQANFSLVNTDNQEFNLLSLRGKWTVLFFGYVNCPSICPATLGVAREAWNQFDRNKLPAQFIFASLNPEQDTPTTLKKFLNQFHPNFMGVTGKKNEMDKLSTQLNIYANKVKLDNGEEIIDHSPYLMLVDPKAQIKAILSPPLDADNIVKDLKALTKS